MLWQLYFWQVEKQEKIVKAVLRKQVQIRRISNLHFFDKKPCQSKKKEYVVEIDTDINVKVQKELYNVNIVYLLIN